MKLKFIFLIFLILSIRQFSYTQVAVFDKMIRYINSNSSNINEVNYFGYSVMVTNNTIRNSGANTPFYQYCSYMKGYDIRYVESRPKTELNFNLMDQSFTTEYGDKFNCSPRDKTSIRIYKVGSRIKVALTLHSWGNNVEFHDATIRELIGGAYLINVLSSNSTSFILTLLPEKGLAPG